ncbi:putative ribonuclease H-like domain-containing protein [Tanacetum coccineum]
MTHPSPKRNMIPKAVLMRSGLVSLTTARPVNTAQLRSTVNSTRPMINVFNKVHSTIKRPINNKTTTKNSNFNQGVNTVKDKNVNTAKPKAVLNTAKPKAVLNVVKENQIEAQGNPSQMMAWIPKETDFLPHGNMSYLTDFEEIDGGYVAFKSKPTLKRENHRQVPRMNNMYSVDLKNIVPKGGLTYLFAKATSDESELWHRILGHINFKTMNKLVKENLVRCLPSKLFENKQTCVACQKGKQHRASYDYSRFSWVFFLATKDETSGILKSFITRVENLIDRKVKAARTILADSKLPTTFWAEAVNTACYVQNRVLVTKPHNKTPYELFLGRKPALGFIRPFGCPVTILSTIDHLGKFDGKADEGFFVGYSINSTKACDDAGKARMETVPGKDYILLPLWTANPPFSQSSKSSPDAGFKPLGDDEKTVTKEPGKEGGDPSKEDERDDQEKDASVNSTNNVNAASTNEVNVVGRKASIKLPDDPNMPALEDIIYSDDDEDVGSEADMNNLDVFMTVSPIPTTRVHKDHPVEQIIRDLNLAPQTRGITKNLEEYGLFSSVLQRTNHKDFQNCLFACFLSQVEPKKVIQALQDPSWIEAMQDELIQFKLPKMDVKSAFLYGKIEEEVYVCQPPGFEDPNFTDRVYTIEKALYGLHQAPRAWYETLSTYLLDNRFQKGKIDKTLFIRGGKGDILLVQVYVDYIIFGSFKKSLCIEFEKMMHKKFQMSSMGELTFFLGLQVKQKEHGIFISQDKYVTEILKKFGFTDVKTASAPMDTQEPLLKDEDGEEVDVYLYRSMIVSLMYLTSLRHDIMFAMCVYSPFDLVAYIDSDYAGASLDRKSTTRGCQFFRCRLISWQCKKQTVVANSTTEAEYVAASSCCGQVLWIQNQLLDYRRPKRKDTQVPQPSDPTNVENEAVNEEPSMQLKELMHFCTKLQQRVLDLENTKTAQDQEITSLKLRVKKLEKKGGSRTHKLIRLYKVGRSARVVSFNEASLDDQEDASKQGKKIDDIDADAGITLDSTHFDVDTDMFGVHDLDGDEVVVESEVAAKKKDDEVNVVKEVVSAAKETVNAATITQDEITLAQALAELKSVKQIRHKFCWINQY